MSKIYGHWEISKSIDEGGQGRIFLVNDTARNPTELPLSALIRRAADWISVNERGIGDVNMSYTAALRKPRRTSVGFV